MMESLATFILVLTSCLTYTQVVSQDIRTVQTIIQSFEVLGAPNIKSENVTEKIEVALTGMKYNFDQAKVRGLSGDCVVELYKIFGPGVQYIENKDYAGLIAWILKSGVVYYVDAWGKPPSSIFLGNVKWNGAFGECNAIPGAHYCLADMKILGKNGTNGQFGTCLPTQCSPEDVSILLQFTSPYTMGLVDFPTDSVFKNTYGSPVLCNDSKKLPSDTIAFIVVLSLLALLCILGTLMEALQDCLTPDNLIPHQNLNNHYEEPNETPENVNKVLHDGLNDSSDKTKDFNYSRFTTQPKNVKMSRGNGVTNFLMCFSILKNTRALISTVAPKDSIRSINGIRAISMTWVLLGHVYFFGILSPPDNIVSTMKINERFTYQAIANAYVSVDSFFFLSGFLVAYISLKKMDRSGGKINYFAFVLHRFIRLTPSYMFAIFIQTSVYPYIVNSPDGLLVRAWGHQKKDMCHKYWWTNLLYINNFYPWQMMNECLGWSWYLANDMQFYVISPFFLVIMYRYRFKGASLSIGIATAIFTLASILIIALKDLPALTSVAWLPGTPLDVRARVGDFGDDFYSKPYTRITPYLVGLFLGFIISRKIYLTRKPNFAITFFGWAVATTFGMLVIYGPYSVFKPGGQMFNTAENILYGSFSRLIWALALAWVVYACQHKMGGWINTFLSWNFWMPIGRLTYGAYLLHPIILNYYYKTMERQWHFQDDTTIFRYLSVLLLAYSFAFLMSIMIDLPVYNLEMMITNKLSKKK